MALPRFLFEMTLQRRGREFAFVSRGQRVYTYFSRYPIVSASCLLTRKKSRRMFCLK